MSDARRGLPLLSEPPPTLVPADSEIACRKCGKEFSVIFVRSRKCNHCGYSYCHSCSDFQAMMPRSGSSETGYDPMHVCGFCIEFLNVTAAGRNALKGMPLAKLKKYVTSYDIKINRAVEKDDIIDGIVAARGSNGCLPPANENFYRKYSVPIRGTSGRTRGFFSRPGQGSSSAPPRPPPRPASRPTYEFPRPDLAPDHPPQPYMFGPPNGPPPQPYTPRPQQHNSQTRPPPSRSNSSYVHTPPPRHQHSHHYPPPHMPPPGRPPAHGGSGYGGHVPPTPPYMSRPQPAPQQPSHYHSHSSPPRAAPYSSEPPSVPPRPRTSSAAPPPGLDQLVEMTPTAIGSLSISALKSILFTNHVTTGQVLEKDELVKKVLVLVADEKADRVRQQQMAEREEMERLQRQMESMNGTGQFEGEDQTSWQEEGERHEEANDSGSGFDIPLHRSDNSESRGNEGDHETKSQSHKSSASTSASPPHPTKPTSSTFERPGICVICQDEDANIAIIDCGHMAMCRGCSDLVMASSKECPLCRTRIVTEARLLRIFRT